MSGYTDFAITYYSGYIHEIWDLIQEYITWSVLMEYVIFIIILVGMSFIISVLFHNRRN